MKNEIDYAKKIQDQYTYTEKEKTNYEKLRELDSKVKKPVNVFSYVYGTVGSLIMGFGMCIAMGVIAGAMPVGILVGLVGMGIMASTYSLHKKILILRKEKYSKEILELSNEMILSSDYKPEKITQNKTQLASYNFDKSNNFYKDNSIER